jgi:hypothetical protein
VQKWKQEKYMNFKIIGRNNVKRILNIAVKFSDKPTVLPERQLA